MEPLIEHRRRFGEFETRVLELEGDGPPVVLLHGYADSADTWRLVLDELGRADRRALAVDLPGFGTATHLGRGSVLEQLDSFVDAVVEHAAEDAGEAVVSGNSLGGALALRAAERCDRLALAGVVPIAPAGFDMAGWFRLIERNPVIQILLALPTPLPEAVIRESVGRVYRTLAFARAGEIEHEVVSAFSSHFRSAGTLRRYFATAQRLLPELADPFRLDRVACPVLLVWGDRDRLVSPTGIDRVVGALPDTQVELIAGCGHCPQIEAAQRVTELLLDFPLARPGERAA
jgi:pimeloyl-ACP methyl ester carboxylesterase